MGDAFCKGGDAVTVEVGRLPLEERVTKGRNELEVRTKGALREPFPQDLHLSSGKLLESFHEEQVKPAKEGVHDCGKTDVESTRCVYGGQRVSTWSLEWLIDERLPGARMNQALKRLIYSPIWYWAWRPIYFAIDLFGLGSSITYTCRRGAKDSP